MGDSWGGVDSSARNCRSQTWCLSAAHHTVRGRVARADFHGWISSGSHHHGFGLWYRGVQTVDDPPSMLQPDGLLSWDFSSWKTVVACFSWEGLLLFFKVFLNKECVLLLSEHICNFHRWNRILLHDIFGVQSDQVTTVFQEGIPQDHG